MNKTVYNTQDYTYLDNAATTITDKDSAEYALKMMCEIYANPSSAHSFGFEAEKHLKAARENILSALGFKPSEGSIIFTSSGTEADNLAIRGIISANSKKGKHIVVSDSEHPAVENTVKEFENKGYTVSRIPTIGGKLDLEYAKSVLTADTILVSCMTINNETGAEYDISSLRKLVKDLCPNAYFHTDAVQAFTKLKNFTKFDPDLISISGHKIHAPKGVGALFIKKGVRIIPSITGGGQENNLRSGTEALALICAFGNSAKNQMNDFEKIHNHVSSLNDYLRKKLENSPDIIINNTQISHTPHILSIAVPGIRSEIMLRYLSERNIFVSAGSACSSKSSDNKVLKNYGLERSIADSTLRISFSKYTTFEQLDKFVLNLNNGISSLIKVKR